MSSPNKIVERIRRRLCIDLMVAKLPPGIKLQRLGTPYGAWEFIALPELRNSTVVCCGLGEDGSFDVEFADHFDATVVIVDPTPRAVRHYHEITERFGLKKLPPMSPAESNLQRPMTFQM